MRAEVHATASTMKKVNADVETTSYSVASIQKYLSSVSMIGGIDLAEYKPVSFWNNPIKWFRQKQMRKFLESTIGDEIIIVFKEIEETIEFDPIERRN